MTSIGNQILQTMFGRRIVSLRGLDALHTEQDLLRTERDALLRDRDALLRERDALYTERDALRSERDRFKILPNTQLILDRLERISSLLRIKNVKGYSKIRIGHPSDGGYVCLSDFDGVVAALSLGIGGDVSWDVEIADRGILVYQYDHTVSIPPSTNNNFIFHQKKVGSRDDDHQISLESILSKHNLTTPSSVIGKIDIEGDEWEVLSSCSINVLATFSQLICELHWFNKINDDLFFENSLRALSALANIFEPVHVHGNNYGQLLSIGNMLFPDVLEVTFVNKNRYNISNEKVVFPTLLDAPNNPDFNDYPLGNFRFPSDK